MRSHPAFAVSQFDLDEKTETYEILRQPGGGGKDILHWTAGWTCQGDGLPARRPETIENWLNYSPAPSSSGAAAPGQPHRRIWVTGAENPRLRSIF